MGHMSDPDAPWRFRYSQATPNKEEQARLDKLTAETARVNEQLRQVKRENAAAEAAAQTLSGRYWFIPSPVHACVGTPLPSHTNCTVTGLCRQWQFWGDLSNSGL